MHTLIKRSRSGYISIDSIDFRAKKLQTERQGGILYNDKRVHSPRIHSSLKCVCIKQQSFKMLEPILREFKGEIVKSTIAVGELNIPSISLY